MTEIEEKKEYLMRYRKIKREIRRLTAEIQELRLLKMYPSGGNRDGMPRGSGQRDLSDYMAAVDKKERELTERRKAAWDLFDEITDCIDALKEEDEREVLVMRYIVGMRWEDIAGQMGYATSHVYKLHGRGLKNLKFLKDDSK